MTTAKVFQSGNSQAFRIPKEMQTTRKELFIRRVGEVYVLYPTDDPWLPLRQVIGSFPDDFMNDREQPSWNEVSEREDL